MRDERDIAVERRPVPHGGIVLCTYALGMGGAERQWIYLAEMLFRRSIPVTFVTYEPLAGPNAHYLPMLTNSGVPSLDASVLEPTVSPQTKGLLGRLADQFGFGQREVQFILSLVAAFRLLTPVAVFAQLDEPNIFAGVAARLCGIDRFVMSFRNFNPTNFDWIFLPWMLPAYRWLAGWEAVRYTGNGAAANKSYADWIGLSTDQIHLIPNTIRGYVKQTMLPVELIQSVKKELKLESSEKVILGVFRLSPEKDPRTFLTVCREVLNRFPCCRVLIVGDGPMLAELCKFAHELGLQHRVDFLGQRSDVDVLMSLGTILLHTSIREGMSNVLMEAQALGLPVVATKIPGIIEAVHMDSAVLCPFGEIECLASACQKLLSDAGLRQKMGAAGKLFVSSNFGEEPFCSQYLAIGMDGMPIRKT